MYKMKGVSLLAPFSFVFQVLIFAKIVQQHNRQALFFRYFFDCRAAKTLLQYHKNLCRILRYFAMKSDEKIAQRAIFSHLINSNYLKIPLPKSAFADIISEYLVFFLYCRSFAETFSTFENYKQDLKHPPICDNRITTAW